METVLPNYCDPTLAFQDENKFQVKENQLLTSETVLWSIRPYYLSAKEKTYLKLTPLHTVSRKHVIQPGNCGKTLGTGVSLNVPQDFVTEFWIIAENNLLDQQKFTILTSRVLVIFINYNCISDM